MDMRPLTELWCADSNSAAIRFYFSNAICPGMPPLAIKPMRVGGERFSTAAWTNSGNVFTICVRAADLVVVGSYVPDGIELGRWVMETARGVTAFYDIDTPVTLASVERGDSFYLSADLIRQYQLYLSFTGGPILERLERHYGAPMARALYCAVDADLYRPLALSKRWDLGYMGTYSADRQQGLQELLLEPASRCSTTRMVVAGPQYPSSIEWPANVERIEHLAPCAHPAFYNQQTFTLNLTRANMVDAGYSPSIRLFEAAACGCPIISDWWEGLDAFFKVGDEILVADSPKKTLEYLFELSAQEREHIGQRARERVLSEHTALRRAAELEGYARQLLDLSASLRAQCYSREALGLPACVG